jgi:hypothetical protein
MFITTPALAVPRDARVGSVVEWNGGYTRRGLTDGLGPALRATLADGAEAAENTRP